LIVVREVSPPAPLGAAVSVSPMSGPAEVDRGIFWHADQSASVVNSGTITIHG